MCNLTQRERDLLGRLPQNTLSIQLKRVAVERDELAETLTRAHNAIAAIALVTYCDRSRPSLRRELRQVRSVLIRGGYMEPRENRKWRAVGV